MYKWIFLLSLLYVFLLSISGCGVIKSFSSKSPENTPQNLVTAGNRALESQDYNKAIEYYKRIKEDFPFSPYVTEAEIKLADAYYKDKQFLAAEDAYKEFESLHPGNENIPYALFQIGMCNFKQFKSIDLPQDHIREALQYFQRVNQSYPTTQYASESQKYIKECKRLLAEHELYVADFYWRTEQYQAAWKRYRFVLENYSEIQDAYSYAQRRSKLAYFLYQRSKSEEVRTSQEGSWKQWFDWL